MTTITMYDSVTLSEVPPNPPAVACYASGTFANEAEARRRFPNAHILTIAVNASHDADCLDVEQGDATPAQAAGWYARQRARGITRPCIYASASVMHADIVPIIRASRIPRAEVRLWSAHYTFASHICGPSSCGEMSIPADACQWTDRALGRNLDESLLAADFFGPVGPPAPAAREWRSHGMLTLAALCSARLLEPVPAVLAATAAASPGRIYPADLAAHVNAVFAGDAGHCPAGITWWYPTGRGTQQPWVTRGQLSLSALAAELGTTPAVVLGLTAQHAAGFGSAAAYIAGVFAGTPVHVPAGCVLFY